MTSHAPSANFVQITISVTIPVVAAPVAFSSARRRQRGTLVRNQRRTIPVCEIVKAVKTPIT